MRTPEGFEKDEIKKYLTSIGAYFILPMTFGYGKSGGADIVACIDGTFWSIEVKREGKTPTALQNARMEVVYESGGKTAAGTAEVVIRIIKGWLALRD